MICVHCTLTVEAVDFPDQESAFGGSCIWTFSGYLTFGVLMIFCEVSPESTKMLHKQPFVGFFFLLLVGHDGYMQDFELYADLKV